jgi:hypothetical protein
MQSQVACVGVEVYLHSFLSSALGVSQWSTLYPVRYILEKIAPSPMELELGVSQSCLDPLEKDLTKLMQ